MHEFDARRKRRIAAGRISGAARRGAGGLSQLANRSRDIFFSLRLPERRFEFVSPAAERLFGFRPEEFLADFTLLLRCVAPDWRAQLLDWVEQCAQGQVADEYVFQIIDRDGGLCWLRVRGVLVPAEGDGANLLQGVASLAAAPQAQCPAGAEGRLPTLAEDWGEQVVQRLNLVDWGTEYISPGVERMTGRTPADFYARPETQLEVVAPHWRSTVASWIEELRQGFLRSEYEFEILHTSGELRWVNMRGVLLRDATGRPSLAQFVVFDVTERRRLEDALAETSRRHEQLSSHLEDVVWAVDRELRWTYLSPSAGAILGLGPESLAARSLTDTFAPASLAAISQAMDARARAGGAGDAPAWLTLEVYDGAGEAVPMEVLARPLRGPDGAIEGYCGTARDIRPRLRREQGDAALSRLAVELLESQDLSQARELVAACAAGLSRGRAVAASRDGANGRLFGQDGAELSDLEAQEPCALLIPVLQAGEELGRILVTDVPMGVDMEELAGRLKRVASLFALALTRLRAQEALRRSERLARMLLESMHEGVWAVDREQRTIFVNERLCAMLGYSVDEFLAMRPQDLLDSVQRQAALERYQERRLGQPGAADYEVLRKDGSRLPMHVSGSPMLDREGNYEGMVMTAADLSERRHMEQELRRNQARFEGLFELSRLAMASERQLAGFTLREALRLTGSRVGALYFVNPSEGVLSPMAWQGPRSVPHLPRQPMKGGGPWAEACAARLPQLLAARGLFVELVPEGQEPPERFLAVPALDGGEPAAVLGLAGKNGVYDEDDGMQVSLLLDGMWRMVRARRDEERIRASLREKEALLREVRHRVKNNLQVVSSLLDMAARRLSEAEGRRSMEEVRAKVQAMSLVHAQLHGGDSASGDGRRGVDLERYVLALFRQLREVYRGGMELEMDMALDDLALGLDQATPLGLVLNEALANVFKHARREDRPGRVELTARRESGGGVRIEVRDDGPGLPPGFEPERAPSLGLKLMFGLVRHQLRGELELHSLAEGVLVRIRFVPYIVS